MCVCARVCVCVCVSVCVCVCVCVSVCTHIRSFSFQKLPTLIVDEKKFLRRLTNINIDESQISLMYMYPPKNYIAIYINIDLFSCPSIVVTQDICVPAAQKQSYL